MSLNEATSTCYIEKVAIPQVSDRKPDCFLNRLQSINRSLEMAEIHQKIIPESKRMSENFLVSYLRPVDPPKSPLKRGTLRSFSPLKMGARGDQEKYLILLRHPLSFMTNGILHEKVKTVRK